MDSGVLAEPLTTTPLPFSLSRPNAACDSHFFLDHRTSDVPTRRVKNRRRAEASDSYSEPGADEASQGDTSRSKWHPQWCAIWARLESPAVSLQRHAPGAVSLGHGPPSGTHGLRVLNFHAQAVPSDSIDLRRPNHPRPAGSA